MKRHVFVVVVFTLTFLFSGLQTASPRTTDPRGNAASDEALPKEMEGLDVKDYYIASKAKPIGLIQTVTGHMVVLHRDTNRAYFAAQGDAIFQQDALFTLEESRCRIKFVTEDVITMGEDTRIDVDEIIDDHELQKKKSTISMLRGKGMFYVVPLFRYKDISTSVKTPTAVCGVRGTKFGVEVRESGGKLAQVGPVYIADASDTGFSYLAQETPADTETVVHCFEGEVEAFSPIDNTTQTVGEGETLDLTTVGAGVIEPTDPAAAQEFMEETEAPAPEEEEEAAEEGAEAPAAEKEAAEEEEEAAEEEAAEGEEPADEGETLVTTDTGDTTAAGSTDTGNTDVTQTQTTTTAEENWAGMTAGEGGYIATIITKLDGTAHNDNTLPVIRDPIYISHTRNLFSGGLETHIGYAVDHKSEEDFKMEVQEIDSNMDMEVTYFRWGHPADIVLGTPHYFEWHQGGGYIDANGHEYLRWGWWEDTETTDTGQIGYDELASSPDDYFFASAATIWEIEGDLTHSDAIYYLQQQNFSATYIGEAKGVYAQSDIANVSVLTGPFSCHINFGSLQVSNLEIDVSGGGKNIHLFGGSGSLNTDGTFNISGSGFDSGSTIGGSNIATGDTSAKGSCFGAKAQGVGGIWSAHDGGDQWATGEFHGKR
ncbi:MAG: FecR domain-containing protein [Desulfobacterales bacterium]|nr:FecR domain-containing protein [Desulfobacterales bacterium]